MAGSDKNWSRCLISFATKAVSETKGGQLQTINKDIVLVKYGRVKLLELTFDSAWSLNDSKLGRKFDTGDNNAQETASMSHLHCRHLLV